VDDIYTIGAIILLQEQMTAGMVKYREKEFTRQQAADRLGKNVKNLNDSPLLSLYVEFYLRDFKQVSAKQVQCAAFL